MARRDDVTGESRIGRHRLRRLPAGIWVLGLVSLGMDLSSEIIHALLPLFLVGTLGTTPFVLGLIEGVAEATAAFVKVLSGVWSDRLGRRKPLLVLGYGLAALSKPLFPLAGSAVAVLAARIVDRIGKGVRGAPRDALIGDLSPADVAGSAYGLRQSLDTMGACAAPLVAVGLMAVLAGDIRAVFWWAVLPAWLAVLLLVLFVRDAPAAAGVAATRPPPAFTLRAVRTLPGRFWRIVGVATLLSLARFSEAFLVLRAVSVGTGETFAPAVMAVMAGVYALTSWPAGDWADRHSNRLILALGIAALILADLMLAAATAPALAFIGAGVWGLHMGLTQAVLSRLVNAAAPDDRRGTAFGIFHLAAGLAMIGASGLAGWLWQVVDPAATFIAGAGLAGLALAALVAIGGGPARPTT
jgi:MFS family permease